MSNKLWCQMCGRTVEIVVHAGVVVETCPYCGAALIKVPVENVLLTSVEEAEAEASRLSGLVIILQHSEAIAVAEKQAAETMVEQLLAIFRGYDEGTVRCNEYLKNIQERCEALVSDFQVKDRK